PYLPRPSPPSAPSSQTLIAVRSTKITSLDVGYNKSNFSASQRMGNTSMMDKINQTGSPAKRMHMKTRHLMPHQNQYTKTTSIGCPASPLLRSAIAPAYAQASGRPSSLLLRHLRQPKLLPNPQSPWVQAGVHRPNLGHHLPRVRL